MENALDLRYCCHLSRSIKLEPFIRAPFLTLLNTLSEIRPLYKVVLFRSIHKLRKQVDEGGSPNAYIGHTLSPFALALHTIIPLQTFDFLPANKSCT